MLLPHAGCERTPGPTPQEIKTVPVSGTVTYEGQPLAGYQVTFLSKDSPRSATGTTDATGRFHLGTNDVGDGAAPGRHSVAIVWAGPTEEVAPGNEQIIDDPALLPKPPIEIPKKYGNPETSGLVQEVPEDGLQDLKIDLKAEGTER
jgi:hypothetical protein